jgi:hypothetical protein
MVHDLKCWPKYYQAVKSGAKPFEIRRCDRDYNVGDTLHLREWDPETEEYTGRELSKKVTYRLYVDDIPGAIWKYTNHVVLGLGKEG